MQAPAPRRCLPRQFTPVVLSMLFSVLGLGGLALIAGCPQPTDPGGPSGNANDNSGTPATGTARDCIGCHTDELLLKQLAVEDADEPEDTGEG